MCIRSVTRNQLYWVCLHHGTRVVANANALSNSFKCNSEWAIRTLESKLRSICTNFEKLQNIRNKKKIKTYSGNCSSLETTYVIWKWCSRLLWNSCEQFLITGKSNFKIDSIEFLALSLSFEVFLWYPVQRGMRLQVLPVFFVHHPASSSALPLQRPLNSGQEFGREALLVLCRMP